MVGTSNLGSWNGHWSEGEKIFVPKGVGSKTTQLIGTSTPGRHSLKIAEKTKLSDSNHQAILPSWFKLWFPEYLYLSIYIYIIISISIYIQYILIIFPFDFHSLHGDTPKNFTCIVSWGTYKVKAKWNLRALMAFETPWFLLEMDVAENGCVWK